MPTLPRLLVATRNAGKAREFAAMLGGQWRVETLLDHPDLPEPVEDGATFQENAAKKALTIAAHVGPEVAVLADDSGLEVDALDGAPGVYSARYAGEPKSDARNNEKLLAALAGVPAIQRGAQFRCSLCLARGGEVTAASDGVCRGAILEAPRGAEGFGYDPLFVPEGFSQTFAEMDAAAKHAISHRARALEGLAKKLGSLSVK
ncbi:MAG: RdgB/HAM1 family non-canonical purine NTP pyrophosphatase [Verrucomicrobium sp.]|nr:RdgB/HAM1 family non-canonical purine NTP pyrophosphatase [Verrucomicrobium sp.]